MKKLYALLALSLSLSMTSYSQWHWIDSLTLGNFQCIHFLNPDTGFVYNDWATLRRTTDGGATWDTVDIAFESYMYDIDFADANVGYAVGGAWFPFGKYYAHSIMKTMDEGLTWDSVYGNHSGGVFQDVEVLSANEFYAVGDYMILHSTDGGSTLDTVVISGNVSETFLKMGFLSPQVGHVLTRIYLSGQNSAYNLYETTDRGASWQISYSDTMGYQGFSDFIFTNTGDGLLFGQKGWIHANKGSNSWTAIPLPDTAMVFRKAAYADGRVYAINYDESTKRDQLYYSTDFGVNWQEDPTSLDSLDWINDMSFPGGGAGYLVTYSDIHKNAALISLAEDRLDGFTIYPNPASEYIRVQLPDEIRKVELELVTINGQSVKNLVISDSQVKIDVSDFASGTYFLVYKADGQAITAHKFIISH